MTRGVLYVVIFHCQCDRMWKVNLNMVVLSCMMRVRTESGVWGRKNPDGSQSSPPLFSDSRDVNEQFCVSLIKAMSHFLYHIFPPMVDYIKEQATMNSTSYVSSNSS